MDAGYSSYADIASDPEALGRYWRAEIRMAKRRRTAWYECARDSERVYSQEGDNSFNVHFANVSVRASARFNSSPIPDARPSHFATNPVAKRAAGLIERALIHQMDQYDFDAVIKSAVLSDEIAGQGVVRIEWDAEGHEDYDEDEQGNAVPRVDPETGEPDFIVTKEVARARYVKWQDYLEGPAKIWDEIPWQAFRAHWSRADLEELGVEDRVIAMLGFASSLLGDPDADGNDETAPTEEDDCIGLEMGWEIWHKESRSVILISEAFGDEVLLIDDSPLPRVPDFFVAPRPLQVVEVPGSRIPVCPYTFYRSLAEDLAEMTERISALTRVIKFRGYRAAELGDDLKVLEDLEDGEFEPTQGALQLEGGLDKAFWVMPIEGVVATVREVIQNREVTKQVVYEVTGISDILRGAGDAQETATAQRIKANMGSMRIQDAQQEVQRFIRDILRLKADVIASHFGDDTMAQIEGVEEDDPAGQEEFWQALDVIRSDRKRYFRVDIETDSTIAGDLERLQANAAKFLDSVGKAASIFLPMAQQEPALAGPILKLFQAIMNKHKLGKQAERAMDELAEMAQQQVAKREQNRPQEEQQQREVEEVQRHVAVQAPLIEIEKGKAELAKARGEAQGQEIENMQHASFGPQVAEDFVGP